MTTKQIEKMIDTKIAAAATPAKDKKPRKPVTLPTDSLYTFKEGEQVALVSANGKIRTTYEYKERLEKFDVITDVSTGVEHRVWLNKLVPLKVAQAMLKAQEKAELAGAKKTG